MQQMKKLPDAEFDIMKVVWANEPPMTTPVIMEQLGKEKEWKIQTVVVRYKSRLTTAFSTNFYGGKKGKRSRIFSIMDTGKKKTGLSILCVALMLTVGTGIAFAANATTQNQPENTKESTEVMPWISGAFLPNPDVYAKYADFGITISEDVTDSIQSSAA